MPDFIDYLVWDEDYDPSKKTGELWTPFDKHGRLNLTFYTDPWWKRLWARLRRQPLWHRVGALRDNGE